MPEVRGELIAPLYLSVLFTFLLCASIDFKSN